MTRTALYRHYDAAGALLYVGITDCLSERDKRHAATAHWHDLVHRTETEWCLSRGHALALEKVAIQFEKPLHNLANREPVVDVELPPATANTTGAERLTEFLNLSGTTRRKFAEQIGIDVSVVSRFARGLARPRVDTAVKIEEATAGKVPVAFWRDARLVGG